MAARGPEQVSASRDMCGMILRSMHSLHDQLWQAVTSFGVITDEARVQVLPPIRWPTIRAGRESIPVSTRPRWYPCLPQEPNLAVLDQGGSATLRRSAARAALWLEAPLARARLH
jgi:hypothetical protein